MVIANPRRMRSERTFTGAASASARKPAMAIQPIGLRSR